MDESSRIRDRERQLGEERQRGVERAEQLIDRERELAEQRIDRERRRADQEATQTRPTTPDEYVEACHTLVYTKLRVETNKALRTIGTIPAPHNKFFPRHAQPWTDFHEQQSGILSHVYEHIPPQSARLFDHRAFLEILGKRVSEAAIANESMLAKFLHDCVEEPVRRIIHELSQSESFQSKLNIGHGITFENRLKALNDSAPEVTDRQRRQPSSPMPEQPAQGRGTAKDTQSDQRSSPDSNPTKYVSIVPMTTGRSEEPSSRFLSTNRHTSSRFNSCARVCGIWI